MDLQLTKHKIIKNKKGKLVVFLRETDLPKSHKHFGQIYFIHFSRKGMVRGNHYHKNWHEWFGILSGRVKVILEDVRTKKRKHITLDAKHDKYTRVETSPYIAHAMQSLSSDASVLSYAHTEWDADDTHEYILIPTRTIKSK